MVLFRVNRFSLAVELAGDVRTVVEYGEAYEEPEAKAVLRGSLFWQDGILLENCTLEQTGTVQTERLGKYRLRYRAEFWGMRAENEQEVSVVDTQSPVITLTEDPEGSLMPGRAYVEAGFQAVDNYDGDITDRVKRSEELGVITYSVVDSSGNPAVVRREIPEQDPIPPEIYLEGGEDYAMTVGTFYEEPGYRAEDNMDGDLTDKVCVEGEVDWLTPGIYPITYTVEDSFRHVTTVTRKVCVEAKEWPDTVRPEGKVIYLTFDDGPGPYTKALLDVLDAYGAKATFFVVGADNGGLMREIVNRGHSIGIHSVSHNYAQIYASPEAFFEDLYGMQKIIYDNTGVTTTLMRFPGGSSNEVSRRYCEGIMTVLADAVRNAGFQFFDWNVYSGDAGETRDSSVVAKNVIDGVQQHRVSLVLQHDIHGYSVDAVEEILRWGNRNGYRFLPLQADSPPCHQNLSN